MRFGMDRRSSRNNNLSTPRQFEGSLRQSKAISKATGENRKMGQKKGTGQIEHAEIIRPDAAKYGQNWKGER